MKTLLINWLWFGLITTAFAAPQESAFKVRVLTNAFVLPGKFDPIKAWAHAAHIDLEHITVPPDSDSPEQWIHDVDLLILDTPRPADAQFMHTRIGTHLKASTMPWLQIGGGSPAYGNMEPAVAQQLIGYYANGGELNLRYLFAFLHNRHIGLTTSSVPSPIALPQHGFYHPDAPALFSDVSTYLAWGEKRWSLKAPRVAFAISRGVIADHQLSLINALIRRSESRGQLPVVFWYDAEDPNALQKLLQPAGIDVLVNLQHMQNGSARKAEFLAMNIPVIPALIWREGDIDAWLRAKSGVSSRSITPLLVIPETWGMSDPIVIGAIENGQPVAMDQQVEALLSKADRLALLRHKAVNEKKLAVLFWNHPQGEKNIAASNLNVPRSLQRLTQALHDAGYDISPIDEKRLIESGQRLLAGYYRPDTLDQLLKDDLAEAFPLSRFMAWYDKLPDHIREQLQTRWGAPAKHWALRTVDGKLQFVIPRLKSGNLLIMPQPPRAGRPGESYHDTKVPPDFLYLAAYQFLREGFEADALIHFGTHGTQEWLPGKSNGLAGDDYPMLSVGDLPVFYPYIQDNIGEALQAKRRGRAVIISHQTPSFAPAGLYDELRDLHELIHQYQQLDQGAVKDTTASRITDTALNSHLQQDLNWKKAHISTDFPGFLEALHEHMHTLAQANTPLGLHTFGEPASAELRLFTVLQQLGKPYLHALAPNATHDEIEPLADDLNGVKASLAYQTLQRYLRDGASLDEISSPSLRKHIEDAIEQDQRLAKPQEVEALLTGLAGGFVAPGPGGDPVRNPQVPSGRNLYGFEADKLPTRAAYEAGGVALDQLIEAYRAEHNGQAPTKLAFSLWSSEAMRHLGILEGEVLHALGLRPVWDAGGRVIRLDIIPLAELGRPRIDAVVQVTSVYRDQFDGFMRLLAQAIEQLAARDELDNPIARNSQAVSARLHRQGMDLATAERFSHIRMFSNEQGDYGTGVSQLAQASTQWDNEAVLAEQFLSRLQYGYGTTSWGEKVAGQNLFSEQLKGVQAAIMARSSELNGVLSTDHPFEFLGGLSSAVRHLDGASPSLYIADLRQKSPRTTSAAQYLASELRSRYLNPQWIKAMQAQGYAGTLEVLDSANNLWGWQATDSSMVRADQWQAMHDTFVTDQRELGLNIWFEQHNPTAQAQLIERMVEAIRKEYWSPDEQTRRELVERWEALTQAHGADKGEAMTRAFIEQMAAGFGIHNSLTQAVVQPVAQPTASEPDVTSSQQNEPVSGQVMSEVTPPAPTQYLWLSWLVATLLMTCIAYGTSQQIKTLKRCTAV